MISVLIHNLEAVENEYSTYVFFYVTRIRSSGSNLEPFRTFRQSFSQFKFQVTKSWSLVVFNPYLSVVSKYVEYDIHQKPNSTFVYFIEIGCHLCLLQHYSFSSSSFRFLSLLSRLHLLFLHAATLSEHFQKDWKRRETRKKHRRSNAKSAVVFRVVLRKRGSGDERWRQSSEAHSFFQSFL